MDQEDPSDRPLTRIQARNRQTILEAALAAGITLREVESVSAGEIVMLAGLDNVLLFDTIASAETTEALPAVEIEPEAAP